MEITAQDRESLNYLAVVLFDETLFSAIHGISSLWIVLILWLASSLSQLSSSCGYST
jgi:hypothetical protein